MSTLILGRRSKPASRSIGFVHIAAVARSFAAELIERGSNERDRFWNDWSETMIAGGCAWLMADCPREKRKLSALFDLFGGDDVVFSMAKLLDEKKW